MDETPASQTAAVDRDDGPEQGVSAGGRASLPPLLRRPPGVYAALDLGTNNCRLLVARRNGGSFRVIDAFSRIVRLGEGLEASGRLSEAAMGRTLEALAVCARKLRFRRVERLRAIATEACRRAANGEDFLRRAREETGLALEVIGTAEEAELALQGCAPLFEAQQPHVLVLDIGGGSTELCWLELPGSGATGARGAGAKGGGALAEGRLRRAVSLPFGVVTLAERYGGREVPAAVYDRMVGEVRAALAGFDLEGRLPGLAAAGALQLVGTSGTVTTLAGVHLCLPRYQRERVDGCHLSRETVAETSAAIRALGFAERAAHPCIGPDRADLVIAGCAILEAVLEAWPLPRLRVADRGLREGMLTRMIREDLGLTAGKGLS